MANVLLCLRIKPTLPSLIDVPSPSFHITTLLTISTAPCDHLSSYLLVRPPSISAVLGASPKIQLSILFQIVSALGLSPPNPSSWQGTREGASPHKEEGCSTECLVAPTVQQRKAMITVLRHIQLQSLPLVRGVYRTAST